ncbi:unnamed protein product [Effrenium voratum]|uniref:PH domain-containing protein n=1 Tax=Effrenium voratum TaxID=2562239 RepID=A0AA36MXM3_9DINO|nr:unnamed protein product [Effrenium voratum]
MAPPRPNPRLTLRGRLSAWLIKARTEGPKAKWFQSLGRRYFTIDFERKVFFYAHGESRNAQVSVCIPFSEILGAHLGHDRHKAKPGIFPFTVRSVGRTLRLEAEEQAEAFRWISMLNAAHRIGADADLVGCGSWLPSQELQVSSSNDWLPSHETHEAHEAQEVASAEKASESTADDDGQRSPESKASDLQDEQDTPSTTASPEPEAKRCLLPSDFGFEDDSECTEPCDHDDGEEPPDSEDSGCESGAVDWSRTTRDLLLLQRDKSTAQRMSQDLNLLRGTFRGSCGRRPILE